MPTAFGHVLLPLSLRAGVGGSRMSWRLTAFCALSAALPDLDVVAFALGIPYGSPWGHRGASHSLLAAFLWALLSVALAGRLRASRWAVFFAVWISTTSHTLLDAITSGGKGVALFWPVSAERIFFPFRPIKVSAIGVDFFSERSIHVLASELVWIGLPSLALALALIAWRVWRRRGAQRA